MGRDPKNPVFQFVPIPNSQCWEMGQVLVLKLMSPEYIEDFNFMHHICTYSLNNAECIFRYKNKKNSLVFAAIKISKWFRYELNAL